MDLILSLFMSLSSLDAIASLFTLTVLEVVLGIDNLIFLSIITNKLHVEQRKAARKLGLLFAMVSRLLFLYLINYISGSTTILFSLFSIGFTIHNLILALGGLFLFYKAIHEIHDDIEEGGSKNTFKKTINKSKNKSKVSFWSIIGQLMIIDIVFSLDSVITAVGMTHDYFIMSLAIIISVILMLFASEPISKFIEKHPTVKMLALSFLILIGTMLMAQSIGYHVEKGYLYFAIAFSLLVESLNIIRSKKHKNI